MTCIAAMHGYPALSARDAIHLAAAQEAGVNRIVSADRHFDLVEDVVRVDPLDLAAQLGA